MGLIITHHNYNIGFRTLQTRFPTLRSHIHIIGWENKLISFFTELIFSFNVILNWQSSRRWIQVWLYRASWSCQIYQRSQEEAFTGLIFSYYYFSFCVKRQQILYDDFDVFIFSQFTRWEALITIISGHRARVNGRHLSTEVETISQMEFFWTFIFRFYILSPRLGSTFGNIKERGYIKS